MEKSEPLAMGVTSNAITDLSQSKAKLTQQRLDDFSDLQLREQSQNTTLDEMEIMSQESADSKMEAMSQESLDSRMEFSSQGSDTSKMDCTNLSENSNTPGLMMSNADYSTSECVLKTDSDSRTRKRKSSCTRSVNSTQQLEKLESVLALRQEALMKREMAVLLREQAVLMHESALSDREDILKLIFGKKKPKV